MQSNTYIQVHTVLRLDKLQEWQTETMDSNRFGFFVTQITWTGRDGVTLSGPGRSRDGKRLSVNRTDPFRKLSELTPELQGYLKQSRLEAIQGLVRDEIKASRMEGL